MVVMYNLTNFHVRDVSVPLWYWNSRLRDYSRWILLSFCIECNVDWFVLLNWPELINACNQDILLHNKFHDNFFWRNEYKWKWKFMIVGEFFSVNPITYIFICLRPLMSSRIFEKNLFEIWGFIQPIVHYYHAFW